MVLLGSDLKDDLAPTRLQEEGHLPPHQIAQSPILPGLENFRGGGSQNFSGQPVSGPHHHHSKEFLPNI